MKNENWGLLQHGIVVYLDLPVPDIYTRLLAQPDEIEKRPLLRLPDPQAKLHEISNSRRDKYEQADVLVSLTSAMSPSDVCREVARGILSFIAENPPKWQEWKKKRDSIAVEAAARVRIKLIEHTS